MFLHAAICAINVVQLSNEIYRLRTKTNARTRKGKIKIPIPKNRRKGNGNEIVIQGCRGNNLKNISVSFPLGLMIGIVGVSGSGKSSLINDTLYPILNNHFYNGVKEVLPYDQIEGIKYLDKVVDVNQSPIGSS